MFDLLSFFRMTQKLELSFLLAGFFLCVSTLLGCAANMQTAGLIDSTKQEELRRFDFKYQLKKPDNTIYLANELQEISGLSLNGDCTKLYAVQDENGILYTINLQTGKIEKKMKFHKDGDYEGIEIVNDDAYVIKSSGTIYELKNYASDSCKVTKYNDFLSKDNDVEGLTYDWKHHQLLLSCKAHAVDMKKGKFKKPIYAFDLKKKAIKMVPEYIIKLKQVRSFLKKHKSKKQLEKFASIFDEHPKELLFSPSAIAIHPFTGNIYITSSVGKLLLVMNPRGKILAIEKLKKKIHPQPEGLAFDTKGTLYISSEGRDDRARIQCFYYHKK